MAAGVGDGEGAPDVDLVTLRPGQPIGRYRIVAVLGQGAFGITYRARDPQLNRDVAIKEYLPAAIALRKGDTLVLPRSTTVAEDFTWGRQRFVDEGRTLATLQRAPAIVRVYDFLEANGTAYIVMELLPGITLEARLAQNKTLTPAEVDKILSPLLDGLAQVHGTGFLHRDIKPANILLDEDGNPTLIDFGASRAAIAGRTVAMTTIFTPGYAAAEQFTSARQGPWTDIYGLSATLYHAITGAPPPSAFERVLDDSYERLIRLLPAGYPSGLLIGLDAGLAVRSTERPQSIAAWRPLLTLPNAPSAEVTVALGRGVDGVAAASAPEPPSPPTPASAPSRKTPLWIGAVAAAVAVAVGGYYFTPDNRPPQPVLAAAPDKAAEQQAAEQAELAKLRAEKASRDKADAEAADRQKAEAAERLRVEDEVRRKVAEIAAQQKAAEKATEEARQQAAAEAEAKRLAQESDAKAAEAAETDLHLTLLSRQHMQVALTALGFNTNGVDGMFGRQTRDMITAWQKSQAYPATGFLTGPESQTLLKAAAPAITRFDDEQRKAKQIAEDRAKAAAPPPQQTTQAPAAVGSPPPPVARPAVPGALREEPPSGALKPGERVLVDDGTCPSDQVKEVTGGNNMSNSTSNSRVGGAARIKRCIPRSSAR